RMPADERHPNALHRNLIGSRLSPRVDQIIDLVCQTVLVSVKATTRSSEGDGTPETGGRTRLRVSAAAICRSIHSRCSAPARSSALTSEWLASHGAISAADPV